MTTKPKSSRKYDHLWRKKLPPWYSVEIEEYEDRKEVLFHSRIHKNMPVRLTFCFSTEFTDNQILNDSGVIVKFADHFHDVFVKEQP